MSDTYLKLAYQTFQQGKHAFGLTHKIISEQLLNLLSPPINELRAKPLEPQLLLKIQQQLNQLIETDWHQLWKTSKPDSTNPTTDTT